MIVVWICKHHYLRGGWSSPLVFKPYFVESGIYCVHCILQSSLSFLCAVVWCSWYPSAVHSFLKQGTYVVDDVICDVDDVIYYTCTVQSKPPSWRDPCRIGSSKPHPPHNGSTSIKGCDTDFSNSVYIILQSNIFHEKNDIPNQSTKVIKLYTNARCSD